MITATVAAGYHSVALLLAVAGLSKLRGPAVPLGFAGVPDAPWLLRVIGVGELAVALAATLVGGPLPATMLAAAYASFTAFALRQRRRGASCGCFGQGTAPVTRLHVAVDATAAATCGAAAWMNVASGPVLLAGEPAAGIPVLAGILLITVLLHLALTALPELLAAMDPQGADA